VLFISSELVGAVGARAGLATQLSAAWQDMRWIGAVGLGLAIGSRLPAVTRLTWTFRVLVTWNMLNLIVSLAELNGAATSRLGIPFTDGVFGHQTFGAIAAVALIIFIISRVSASGHIRLTTGQASGLIVAIACIVLGTRFKALLPLAVVGSLLLLFRHRMPARTIALIAAAVPIVTVAALLVFAEGGGSPYDGQSASSNSVVDNALSHGGTRVTLLDAAVRLAGRTAPFGRGLGTFGSNINDTLEEQSFEAAGLAGVYGYTASAGAYRSDNFVAHVLAERGYLGLVIFVLALIPLLVAMIQISGGAWLTIAGPVTAIALAPLAATFNSAPMMIILIFPAALGAQATISKDDRAERSAVRRGDGRTALRVSWQ
jgi:hypothetical protein